MRMPMNTKSVVPADSPKIIPIAAKPAETFALLRHYGCDVMQFAGGENALYDRHLLFDRAIDPNVASSRERFEAFSHSVRDLLAQRWVKTKQTYEQQNAK